jgi:hypothetical protein
MARMKKGIGADKLWLLHYTLKVNARGCILLSHRL